MISVSVAVLGRRKLAFENEGPLSTCFGFRATAVAAWRDCKVLSRALLIGGDVAALESGLGFVGVRGRGEKVGGSEENVSSIPATWISSVPSSVLRARTVAS